MQFIGLRIFFKALHTNCNRFKQKYWIRKSWFKQQINFIGRPDEDIATMFFIIEKSEKTTFEFSQNAVTVAWFILVRLYIKWKPKIL